MAPDDLIVPLTAWLATVVPVAWRPVPEWPFSPSEMIEQDVEPARAVEMAVHNVLDNLQDDVVEDTRTWWPAGHAGGATSAPSVVVRDGAVRLGYADEGGWVLTTTFPVDLPG